MERNGKRGESEEKEGGGRKAKWRKGEELRRFRRMSPCALFFWQLMRDSPK